MVKLDTFSCQLQYNITKHKRSSLATDVEIVTKDAFTYSPQDRLLTQTHRINAGTIEVIANNIYDELGQLISKKVGNTIAAPTQKVDYTYNIRGWLTGINNTAALQQGSDPKDLFAFKINYNIPTAGITNVKPLYNGNISETQWATNSDNGVVRTYGYKYDNLNRLKEAVYKKGALLNNYNESIGYDKNGNITNLTRYGSTNDNSQTLIDNLTYSYKDSNTANQLMKVTDAVANNANFINEFKDSASNSVDDYSYDFNGNMTKDNNKNITAVTYNHLNLPTKITFATTGNIVYIYNAAGQKVQKIVNEIGKSVVTTDYLGGYQYDNNLLKFFPTAEGYVEPSGSSYKYVYQYKDHLGNVRLSYDKTLVIKEESNFYPFGLKQEGYNTLKIGVENKYKYQGQERQDELGLNWDSFKWRNYDMAIGRFMSIDPLAEKYSYQSPYNFCENRVIDARELEGLEAFFIHGTTSSPSRWTEKAVSTLMRLTNNKTSNTGFSWESRSGISNDSNDRNAAAKTLVDYITKNRVKGEGITLIGHSHGGNVAIQAAKMFFELTGGRIDIITVATPAYNTPKNAKGLMEDPNTKLGHKAIRNFLSLFNTIDGVQGGLAGSKYFNQLGGDGTYTRNAGVIDVSEYYSSHEVLDAHSFDVEHPNTIQNAINNGEIKKFQYMGSAGSADDPKNKLNIKK